MAAVIVTTTEKVFVHLQIREQLVVSHGEHYIHKRKPFSANVKACLKIVTKLI